MSMLDKEMSGSEMCTEGKERERDKHLFSLPSSLVSLWEEEGLYPSQGPLRKFSSNFASSVT